MKDDNNPYRTMPPASEAAETETWPIGEPMSVAFSLSGDDLAAFSMHWTRSSGMMRRRWRSVWLAYGSIAAVCALIAMVAHRNEPTLARCSGFAAIALVAYMLYLMAIRDRRTRRWYQSVYQDASGRGLLGPRQLTISTDGATQVSDISESRYKWIGIDRVEIDLQHAFLYIGSAMAIIIPKRAFHSEEHFRAFVETARLFQRHAAEAARILPSN